jgi:hypothetical protein
MAASATGSEETIVRKTSALICAAALASAGAAQAHVVFAETEAAPNAY